MVEREEIRRRLRAVYDPEVGVNIVDLGLVYDLEVALAEVRVTMTLTSAACPLGAEIAREIEEVIRVAYPEITKVTVAIVWEPPWHPGRMSSEARAALGWR